MTFVKKFPTESNSERILKIGLVTLWITVGYSAFLTHIVHEQKACRGNATNLSNYGIKNAFRKFLQRSSEVQLSIIPFR